MDCSSQGECNHSHSHGEHTAMVQSAESHTDECQEAVEGWTEEGEAEGEAREDEWAGDEAGEIAAREEWGGDEEEVREEWREEEESREEWTERGNGRQEQWTRRERHRVDEWAEGDGEVRCEVVEQDPDEQIYNGRPEPILEHHHQRQHQQPPPKDEEEEEEAESEEYCPNEEEDEEGDDDESHGGAYTGDYYAPEDNGNSVRASPFRGRKVLVVEGETGEEAEEDIDQIVAEIKMSMSMGSLSSGTDQSPEELVQDSAPGDYPHSKPDAAPYAPAHHRHDSRPKSLNLPSTHHNDPDLQRGIKVHPQSPEGRPRWTQEQVSADSFDDEFISSGLLTSHYHRTSVTTLIIYRYREIQTYTFVNEVQVIRSLFFHCRSSSLCWSCLFTVTKNTVFTGHGQRNYQFPND